MATEITYLSRPARRLGAAAQQVLVEELREVGRECLSPLPDYQVFVGTRAALDDKVLMLARDGAGRLQGFSSGVLLQVDGAGEVLHLGLTCVREGARGGALAQRLLSGLMLGYLLRTRPFGEVYVTNVACVLSSLGSFALALVEPYPAPWVASPPEAYRRIAASFDREHREKAYVQPGATFDWDAFVFRRSGLGTAFQKDAEDARYFHRDRALNDYYRARLHFEDGDEMLQVGRVSVAGLLKYWVRRQLRLARPA